MQNPNDPRLKPDQPTGAPVSPEATGIGREGGDDSLSNIRPTDDRADEQVIVNEQASNQTVNRPSQTEIDSTYGDVVNE